MKWVKRGVVFAPNNNFDWMVSHASVPLPDRTRDGRLRIYFAARDRANRSHPGYVEVEADDPGAVSYVHDRPILPLGRPGAFDDSGIMPSWIVEHNARKYLYYVGWNPQVTVAYRLAIGLAISDDGGQSFAKFSEGPILDRDAHEPFFNTTPCVLCGPDGWRMWYSSCTGWALVGGRLEPFYHVKEAVSDDGVHWRRTGRVCIDYDHRTDAIACPSVYRWAGAYRMFYSFRRADGYRTDPAAAYRLGYACSADGEEWTRLDEQAGIEPSASGWDCQMVEYGRVAFHRGKTYLFYNGNGFGRSGFGYAELSDPGEAAP